MPRLLLSGFLLITTAAAECPNNGKAHHDRCWYLSQGGQSCGATCSAQGLGFSQHVAGEADPMIPKLVGRAPGTRQFAWGRIECYVESQDRYHTAKEVTSSDTGDNGDAKDWAVSVCSLACPCTQGAAPKPEPVGPPADPNAAYPACVQQGAILRHAGAHAIFVDMSVHGSAGCWQNDCKHTDKFNAVDMGICARACAANDDCTHWSYGEQDGSTKCFLRKSDAGQEGLEGFVAAPKSCQPPKLPAAHLAFAAAEALSPCDGGKSDACPDMARAINTWKFAISNLKEAAASQLDESTQQYIAQVQGDSDAFAAQMSEENFPVIVGNNRQVFNALAGWLANTPRAQIDPNDASLPNPLRGKLCGPNSCFDEL